MRWILQPQSWGKHIEETASLSPNTWESASDFLSWVKFETLKNGNNSISYIPERWGHILSCKIDGRELFFPFFGDPNKPKWGMPYMFPNAGPLSDTEKNLSWFDLPQHGFGRISKWKSLSPWVQELVFEAGESFPYSWKVIHKVEIGNDESIVFTQTLENIGNSPMPVSTGLHPYFRIPRWDISELEWRFTGGEKVKEDLSLWSEWGTGHYDIPADRRLLFFIPGLWEITLELSSQYNKFWVWSLPDKDFVCVEPVMNHEGGIVNTPVMVKPWERNENFMRITLKQ